MNYNCIGYIFAITRTWECLTTKYYNRRIRGCAVFVCTLLGKTSLNIKVIPSSKNFGLQEHWILSNTKIEPIYHGLIHDQNSLNFAVGALQNAHEKSRSGWTL